MGDDIFDVIKKTSSDMAAQQKDKIVSSIWDSSKSAFENLLGSVWTHDTIVYDINMPNEYSKYISQKNFMNFNKLQILSDRVIISNLSTGFASEDIGESKSCADGYIFFKYHTKKEGTKQVTNFKDGGNRQDRFEVILDKSSDDVPGDADNQYEAPDNVLSIIVDRPLEIENAYITAKDKNSVNFSTEIKDFRNKNTEPLLGLRIRMSLDFQTKNCGVGTVATNRLHTDIDNTEKLYHTYWKKIFIRNACSDDNVNLTRYAVLAKCMKYGVGNYSNNIEDIYHSLVVSAAGTKNVFNKQQNYNGQQCTKRNEAAYNACTSSDVVKKDENNKICAKSLSCEWRGQPESSIVGNGDSTCPIREEDDKKCFLSSDKKFQNTVDSIKESISLYHPYTKFVDHLGNSEYEEGFGLDESCNKDIINKIENICKSKNIGISYKWSPNSCDPTHVNFDRGLCNAKCDSQDNCKAPTLIYEPDFSPFKCSLDGLNNLENHCKKIMNKIKNNPTYLNLGITKEQLELPGYDETKTPFTTCNIAALDSHLIYIKSLLFNKYKNIQKEINDAILESAEKKKEYAKNKNKRLEEMSKDIIDTNDKIEELQNSVLNTFEKVGRVNNDFTKIKKDITLFRRNLDEKYEKKKRI